MAGDDNKSPPTGVPIVRISEKQAPSARHRDHSRARSQAEPPSFVEEEHTEQYDTGAFDEDELRRRRNTRDTKDRLTRLEEKHDGIVASVTRLETNQQVTDGKVDKLSESVADMGGQFKVIPRLVDAMEKATNQLAQRDHVTFTAKVDVDKARDIGEVEVRKTKWQLLLKIAAVLGAIGTAIATAVAAGNC